MTQWIGSHAKVDTGLFLSLADRCEDRGNEIYLWNDDGQHLAAEIDVAVYGGEIVDCVTSYTGEHYYARRYASTMHIGGFGRTFIPAYLISIDAAMGLLRPEVTLLRPEITMNDNNWWKVIIRRDNPSAWTTGISNRPAAALTAAALRARVALFTQKNLDDTPAII
jgi:hypothetical protein